MLKCPLKKTSKFYAIIHVISIKGYIVSSILELAAFSPLYLSYYLAVWNIFRYKSWKCGCHELPN